MTTLSAAQHAGRLARWWARTRDVPEVALLYAWVGAAIAAGVYSTKRVMLSNIDGAYWDVELRGDVMKQAEAAGTSDQLASGKRSLWYRIAQIKMDDEGANIGILFDNRARPLQYAKPGEAYGITMGAL